MKTKTRGQSLVEFALILPVLLLLILGIIEGARIIWAYITVQNAAREAARYAVTGQPFDELGNPWTLRADRYSGCNPEFDEQEALTYEGCEQPNDRVDAIIGVAMELGKGLGFDNDQLAISPNWFTATGYVDTGGTYGVNVWGQKIDGGEVVLLEDFAGTEGLNVLVQVYYNVELLDPLYAAIIPNGFVPLRGEVLMQNEGIDQALSNIPPPGIVPPPGPGELQPPPPGQPNPPIILSLDGSSVEAGSDLNVRLEYHPAEGRKYDIYLHSLSLGYAKICSDVEPSNFGTKEATCFIPPNTNPGSYQLVSIEAGGDADPANHIGEGDLVEVLYPGQPLVTIADSSRWPPGSSITFLLYGHQPCPGGKSPCPPYQEYDIALIGPGFAAPGELIATVRVDQFGSAVARWSIPSTLSPGDYSVKTYRTGDTEFVPVAETALQIVEAEVVIQGGNRWPSGTTIRVNLRGHAPDRTYRLRWIDGRTGAATDMGTVTTDQFGNTVAPVQFRIPPTTADSPPDHRIISVEEGGSGEEVAGTDVEVYTPEDAIIVVVGGNEWPAGTAIQIELHEHHNGPYELYFDELLIEGDIAPDAEGFYQTTYVIPIATSEGEHEIRTERVNGDIEATTIIDVESVPLISLKEGSIVRPRSDITVQLFYHPPDDSFEIYLAGNRLFTVQTNSSGSHDGVYTYDLNRLADLEGGPFVLESRKDGLTVASTEIYILAPDLRITNIEFPPGPPVNQEIPVTVTVRNDSPAPISGEWFDVDLYLDPLHPPTTSSQFPPGDYKRWADSVPSESEVAVIFYLTLRGTDHIVYGRVDTSNYIVESNETNNIYEIIVQSDVCVGEITEALNNGASWTGRGYGDAGNGTFTVGGGAINVVSDGSSTWDSSDNMYVAYYNQQMAGGDFEMRVRMVQGPGDDPGEQDWAKAGLEIRSNVGDASSPKVELGVTNSDHTNPSWQPAVQAAYRDASGGTGRAPGAETDRQILNYPVWLRVVRSGDRFDFYYSDSNSATPPPESAWISHGSVQMGGIGEQVAVGFFNASYDTGDMTSTSSFDNFYVCLKGAEAPPPGEDFPPGLTVCTDNLIQNAGFEDMTSWDDYGGIGNGVNIQDADQHQGDFAALMMSGDPGGSYRPKLGQSFTMPEWIISETSTVNLSLHVCVRDVAGSGADPEDLLRVGLRTAASQLLTAETQETLVATGNTSNHSDPCTGNYVPYSTELAQAMQAAGNNPENYAGDSLELYFYSPGNCFGSCKTHFRIDSVGLEVCTTQLEPEQEENSVYKVGGPLRVFIGGAPQPKQGVRVWTYRRNGELLTTYSLDDSNYFFYNLEPNETYVIYAEYWDGPNLYSAFREITVRLGDAVYDDSYDPPRLVILGESLLLR